MAKKHLLRPFKAFHVTQTSTRAVEMISAAEIAQIEVLAPDLFRLRVAKGRAFSAAPSWAVSKTDWPECPAEIGVRDEQLTVRAAGGSLTFNLRDGAWSARDACDHLLFSSDAAASGFEEVHPQLALRLEKEEKIFGLGETTGTFNKRGLLREFWNIDVLGHAPAIHPSLRSLYVSIPFALSMREGRAAGLFWDNTHRQTWDIGQTRLEEWKMKAHGGEFDLYLFLGPSAASIVSRYTELTGRIPLPPRWGLGYQQCRYSYETRERVEEIARQFRQRQLPCDVIYFDIHHMDGYRVFTMGKTFPKPEELMEKLSDEGFKVVVIVDPGVKDDPKFPVLQRGVAVKAFVKTPTGRKDYVGKVWPGPARFPDFLNRRVRSWWGDEQARLQELGIAGFWNDMNEPANFARPSKTLSEKCLHDTDAGPMNHGQAHNLYGMQMARASREGALSHRPHERPFVITRAGYAGVQRYALVWTGDNSSVWEHLSDAVQMFLNMGVSGVAFCGGDVGGFLDNANGELLVRWLQFATFTPFFRNHSNLGTIDQEPWSFGAEVEKICRHFIELRYQLIPCIYGLFNEAHQTGAPIMRPMFWHYQDDPEAVPLSDQFLLGRDLLVAPILRQGATARSVYLPAGDWHDFWTGEKIEGGRHVVARASLDRIPVYARAGALLPMGPVKQFIADEPETVANLHVWPGADGELNWYDDQGRDTNYMNGVFEARSITWRRDDDGGVLEIGEARGDYEGKREWRVIFREMAGEATASIRGRKLAGNYDPAGRFFAFTVSPGRASVRIRVTTQ
jgi:alpha-glucosidase